MASSVTIRNISDELKQKLRERAAKNGNSMEAEVRNVITKHVELKDSDTKQTTSEPKLSELPKDESLKKVKELFAGGNEYFYKNWKDTDDFMRFMRG